ncbi:hypothetical protein PM082_014828 [Marasmius tenuissimus]|nr:hypothetical protein PM082_014828 [Marasmius tenuissimus]
MDGGYTIQTKTVLPAGGSIHECLRLRGRFVSWYRVHLHAIRLVNVFGAQVLSALSVLEARTTNVGVWHRIADLDQDR